MAILFARLPVKCSQSQHGCEHHPKGQLKKLPPCGSLQLPYLWAACAAVRETGQAAQCSTIPDSLEHYLWILLLPELCCAFCGHKWSCWAVIITEGFLGDLWWILSVPMSTSQQLPRQLEIVGGFLVASAETLKRRDWTLALKLAQRPISYKKIALLLLCLLLVAATALDLFYPHALISRMVSRKVSVQQDMMTLWHHWA